MILLRHQRIETVDDACRLIQMAVQLELTTLPPYLYALYTILPDRNREAAVRIRSVALEEMIHMCLACNLLNALGTTPVIASAAVAPKYPGTLPGDIGGEKGAPFEVHLLPFSPESMLQAMKIEEPEDPLVFPVLRMAEAAAAEPEFMTIGQFYQYLDDFLRQLPAGDWSKDRNQIIDAQFFAGQLFAIGDYESAHTAIQRIVSEGEGSKTSPLDFQQEVAHFYRFEEIYRNSVLTKADNPQGFGWGGSLGVDWSAVAPAISDPGCYDFSRDPAAGAAQDACDAAYTRMLDELQRAVGGEIGRLGNAVRAMYDLRMAALVALATPLAGTSQVAGPAFRYRPAAADRSAP